MWPSSHSRVVQVGVVADAVLVQELVELVVVDAMQPLHFPVQPWRVWANVDMPDLAALKVPVELRVEVGTVIGPHHVQPAHKLVDELLGRALVGRCRGVLSPPGATPRTVVGPGRLLSICKLAVHMWSLTDFCPH